MTQQTPNARRLRRDTTPAEVIVWRELRNRRFGGVKFRRQQPLDRYIADFFCAEARLVIELDGDSHMGKEERDANRQRYIEALGIRVIRFWNCEVYDELPWVLDCIGRALDTALGPAKRNANVLPSPLAGEGGGASPRVRGELGARFSFL